MMADAVRAASPLGTKRKRTDANAPPSTKQRAADETPPRPIELPAPPQTSPADFVDKLFREHVAGGTVVTLPFIKPTKEMIDAYKLETIQAARSQPIDKLRKMHLAGTSFNCCNRFGESLVHMACRRGNVPLVRFLVQEAKVTLFLKDDFGRTVLHDACWTAEPNFALVEFLLSEVPEFLCVRDVRGHFPLHYVRKEHWKEWLAFIHARQTMFRPNKNKTQSSKSAGVVATIG